MAGLFDEILPFGAEEEKKNGKMVSEKLTGMYISKAIAKADQPGGLRYEAEKLGIGTIELLRTLEGMCAKGTAIETDDSTYYVS